MQKIVLSALLVFPFLNGCNIINPPEEIPAYIHVDSISLQITDTSQGSAAHKITDAWLYVDEKYIGTFEMPFTVPVLHAGQKSIRVFGGIKANGIAATRINYPFYESYVNEFLLVPAETLSINPAVTYMQQLTFAWMENFEKGISIATRDGSTTDMNRINSSDAFEGNYYGAVNLSAADSVYIGRSVFSQPLKFPTGGHKVFLELNYRNNNAFYIDFGAVFLTGIEETPLLRINPSLSWNKIYIDLTEKASTNFNATEHYIIFYAQKDSAITDPYFHVDNIKLVY